MLTEAVDFQIKATTNHEILFRDATLGSAVELSIPKNTSSGRIFRLKGKGLPKTGGNGDLFVTTRIVLPDGNDAELEALMQKWRDGHPYNPRSDLSS